MIRIPIDNINVQMSLNKAGLKPEKGIFFKKKYFSFGSGLASRDSMESRVLCIASTRVIFFLTLFG